MRDQIPDSEHYLRMLKVCEIDEDDYFSRLICEDITAIAKDIKESHRRDAETGDENNPLTDVIDVVKKFAMATNPMKATLSTLSKQLCIIQAFCKRTKVIPMLYKLNLLHIFFSAF